MIFEEAVDTLLKQKVRITNRQVRLLTNLSRQTIATYLGRLVDNGQLIRTGRGRSLSYEPGKERTEPSRTLPESNRFWTELAAKDPDLRYVRIATSCPRRTRRSDAERRTGRTDVLARRREQRAIENTPLFWGVLRLAEAR